MLSDLKLPNVFIVERGSGEMVLETVGNVKNPSEEKNDNVKNDEERGNWESKTEYILSCLGYAIGIGNVWRFPYLCYRNGGGAFLVPYFLMLVVCGLPLYFMETCWGQFANVGCITMFKISPLFKGAGFAMVVVNVIVLIYYNVIISYPLLYLYYSIETILPWTHCENAWNTKLCMKLDGKEITANKFINNSLLDPSLRMKTPADEFFHNSILEISPGIDQPNGIVWPLFAVNLLSWVMIFLCIRKGVKSVGKVVYFTATFPFLILGVLLIRGLTLPGAMEGVKFYILPEWKQLKNFKVWADAAVQIFFSLGPGWGGIINMASFNRFRNDTKWDSISVPLLNAATSVLSGFVVFSVLGYMSHQTGLPVSMVATGGPGLAYVTYPEAIGMLPFPQFWAVLFFVMLYLLGMDTVFVQIEAVINSVLDEYPSLRPKKEVVSFLSCLAMFLGSIACVTRGGIFIVQLLDWYSASVSVILICITEIIVISWIYGIDNFVRDIEFMIGKSIGWGWKICWKYITPAVLISIFFTTIIFNTEVTYNALTYPKWSIYVGWTSCGLSMICIPIYIVYKILKQSGGSLRVRIRTTTRPSSDWGPSQENHRIEWQNMIYAQK